MSKKMHRCPYCGGKGYSFYTTATSRYSRSITRGNYDNYDDRYIIGGYDECINHNYFSTCNICNGKSAVYRNGRGTLPLDIFESVSVIVIIALLFLQKYVSIVIPVISLVILIAFVLISSYYSCYFGCLLPIRNEGDRKYLMVVSPNCKVQLNDKKYIRSMWVYGLKFDTETKNVKFKERFEDGLVPAQFYPTAKDSNTYDIRIIDKEFVPDEILFEGAEFLVEDIDGIFICKGKVTKTDLDY